MRDVAKFFHMLNVYMASKARSLKELLVHATQIQSHEN
jgi:hypothetical protein